MRFLFRFLIVVVFAFGVSSIARADKRVALIVANGVYKGAPLPNPTVDADLVAASLRNIGFAVTVVKNADLATFDSSVNAFAESAQGADVALFYFAGHGFTVNEGIRPVSMLMSTSAEVTSSSDRLLRAGGIALDEIVGSLTGKAQATLVFVDACRNDPRVSRAVGGGQARGFARLEPVQGGSLFIGLSTRLGSVAQDGDAGKGSPFARAFAATIQTKGMRVDDAFRQLRDAVKAETKGRQLPDIVQDDLPNGAITLVAAPVEPKSGPRDDAGAESPVASGPANARLGEAAQIWASLRDSNDAGALSLFKTQYEGTFYAKLAALRLDQIGPKTRPTGQVGAPSAIALAGECDQLAAAPGDATRPAGIAGVVANRIDAAKAVPACRAAVAVSPNDPRMVFQLGRALAHVAGGETEAVQLFRQAADAGHLGAMNNLGISLNRGVGAPKDEAEGLRWLHKAADAGYAIAMTNLGNMYENGNGLPKDEAEAMRWYRKAADAGDPRAMNRIGNIYYYGKGAPKDLAEAAGWYRKAADAGYVSGMINLGLMYESGFGVEKDEAEAARWYRKAVDAGDVTAMTDLGFRYERGIGVAKDPVEAVRWYQKAADAGDARGMHNLGVMYQNGFGVPKNPTEALRWYQKAADAGNTRSMIDVGLLYEYGNGAPRDEAEALRWYRKGADAGSSAAMNRVGSMYAYGKGTPKDLAAALLWYRKAADLGDAPSMNLLGTMYASGAGTPKDDAEAFRWFRKAADAGYAPGMVNLGLAYANGKGTPKDDVQAVAFYRKAADLGDTVGMNFLGAMYSGGVGAPKDDAEAVRWFRKAADAGNVPAMVNLGLAYASGKGTPKDDVQAVALYRKAADKGDAGAMYDLGFMYESGNGVPRDSTEALRWYQKAAGLGNANAKSGVIRLAPRTAKSP